MPFSLSRFLSRYAKPDFLTLYMDEIGIRLIRIHRDQENISLVQYLSYPFPEEGMGDQEVPALQRFLQSHQFIGLPVATNIEDSSLRIRRVEVPKMPDEDLKEAVKWSMREFLDGPIEDYTIRFTPLEELVTSEAHRLGVVAYGIRTQAVEKRANFLKLLGLKPFLVEPNAVAILSAYDWGREWVPKEYHAVVDLGWQRSHFIVAREGKLYFSRPLEKISLKKFFHGLRDQFQLNEEVYKKMINLCNFDGGKVESLLPDQAVFQTALARFLQDASLEIQSSIDSFSVLFHVDKIDFISLCGGGTFLPQVEDRLGKNLGIPTRRWQLLSMRGGDFQGLDSYYMAAFGLGIKQGFL